MAATQQAKTRVFSDVDFERKGKQATVLRVPQSRNDSGWGVVQIPITVIKNGKGKTVLLTGGVHGDEYESQIAIAELARNLDPADVQGRLIIIPALHFPAAMNGTRLSPIDNKDLNRCFPGRPEGTFADVLAHYVSAVLLPLTDVNIDLHSGGRAMDFVPSTTAHVLDDKAKMAESTAIARAFGAPYHVVIKEVDAGYTFMTTCERNGVTAISSELGGANRVSIPGLKATRRGIMNSLKHLDLLKGKLDTDGPKTRIVTVPDYGCYAFAPVAGLFEAYHPLGARVRKGDAAGALHFIDDPRRKPEIIAYGYSGEVWCTRGQGPVVAGDPVAVLVADQR